MIEEKLKPWNLVLASQSPRRLELLRGLNIPFTVKVKPTDEEFDKTLQREEIPLHIAKAKAAEFRGMLDSQDLLITADTIVWINNHVLNKPADASEAEKMLSELSGKMHEVYTAVCLTWSDKQISFYDRTSVYFRTLSPEEIAYYVERYKPLDKAGAYGIQEWIGYVGIERFDGCFYNVMGLPLRKLYEAIRDNF